ncbi:hypothetical protein V9T40_011463 [Parthenolecanium corni]|uniref:Battenin n=1 Tax=Parthenolecanium corni TaxID=536013 RepID=A0AAN9XYG2_9HEMI
MPCVGRSAVAYWVMGLSNSFGYTVLICAAEDILSKFAIHSDEKFLGSARQCNASSTGIILLADIIPSMVAKAIAPFFPLWMNIRIFLVVLMGLLGFALVPTTNSLLLLLIGIILSSLSRGLGESSLLSYTVFYEDKSVLSAWSSGTGAAGLFGSIAYAVLKALDVRTHTLLLSLVILPLIISVCFWVLLKSPFVEIEEPSETTPIVTLPEAPQSISEESFHSRIQKIPLTLKYMAPLFICYYFVYVINQGLFEMSIVKKSLLDYKTQYRWYQVCYNIGVFISRSSITWVKVDSIWCLAILQGINVVFFTCEALFMLVDNVFVIFAVIIWEGLLCGAAYINTFYKIQKEERAEDQEVMTGITLVSDNIGITMSGLSVIVIHNTFCNMFKL